MSVNLSVNLSVSICLSVCLSVCLSISVLPPCLTCIGPCFQLGSEPPAEWRSVWVLSIHLWTQLLRSQKHFFVTDAVDFAAVHCSSLCAAISQVMSLGGVAEAICRCC